MIGKYYRTPQTSLNVQLVQEQAGVLYAVQVQSLFEAALTPRWELVLGKESRMLSNQIFCFSSFTFPSLSGIKPCQQGEKLCFSVWRVTFYAQFLHTVRSADIVSVSWLFLSVVLNFFVQRREEVSARCSAMPCAVLCSFCSVLFPAVGAVFMHLRMNLEI